MEEEIKEEFIGEFYGGELEPTKETIRIRTYKNKKGYFKYKKQWSLTWKERYINNFEELPYFKYYKKGTKGANKEIVYRVYYFDLDLNRPIHDETTNIYEATIIKLKRRINELVTLVDDYRHKLGLKQNPDEWEKHELKKSKHVNKVRMEMVGYGDRTGMFNGGIGGYGGL